MTLVQLLLDNSKLRRKIFRDQSLPENIRQKAAVISIENILIDSALKRKNRPLGNGTEHGLVVRDKPGFEDIAFFWFGNLHGLCIVGEGMFDPSVQRYQLDELCFEIQRINNPYGDNVYITVTKDEKFKDYIYERSKYIQEIKKILMLPPSSELIRLISQKVIQTAVEMKLDPELFG